MEPTLIIALLTALFVATHNRNGLHAESRLDGQPARRELFVALYLCATVWMEVYQ